MKEFGYVRVGAIVNKLVLANPLKNAEELVKNIKEAYKKAINDSDPSDLIFVGGSTFIVADLLSFLKQKCLTSLL